MKLWDVEQSEYVLKTPWFVVRKDACRLPDGGLYDYYVREQGDVARIFCLTKEGKVVLNRQYRHGMRRVVYELPSGYLGESDASPEAGAARELLEETGYRAARIERLGTFAISEADSTGQMYICIGYDAEKVQEPEHNPQEVIESSLVSPKDLRAMMREGVVLGLGQIAAIEIALHHLRI